MNVSLTLRQALERIGSLPPIPLVAQRILSLKINTDEGERALLQLIERDPPILAKVIGLANSPLFGTSRKILNLHDAAAILGSKRVKMVALSFAMMAAMARKSAGHLDMHKLWQHSLSVALTMDTLAHLMPSARRPADEEIYLAGLLHDIGFMVLDYLDPDLSDRFHARLATEPGCTVEQIETEMLETSHGELGAILARHWNLPESVAVVLQYHHTPDDPRATGGQPLVGMACMAEKLLPTFGIVEPVMQNIDDSNWQALGIDPARAEEVRGRVLEHMQEVAAATNT
ncbi:MAG: HDOD domain-containing protein [Gammaproteobacteria bacterium]|nr:HDOD domain-containing protein [Sideroxydans sp.]MBU3903619.1 HDOD domain-containing protein [Gammaproteobacteria bacterium]MBU4045935.1 HDOD domain-containing protein [Gammaproteobacteria bacterium]MBU4151191.1 HDOD domain-containing protein [Gammaproteobacteria bacterium]